MQIFLVLIFVGLIWSSLLALNVLYFLSDEKKKDIKIPDFLKEMNLTIQAFQTPKGELFVIRPKERFIKNSLRDIRRENGTWVTVGIERGKEDGNA